MKRLIENNEQEVEDLQKELEEAQMRYKDVRILVKFQGINEEGLENAINVVDELLKSRQDTEAKEVDEGDGAEGEEDLTTPEVLQDFINIASSIQKERRAINKLEEENFEYKFKEM